MKGIPVTPSEPYPSGRPLFAALRDGYESYYKSAQTGIVPIRRNDQRLYPKEFVLGVAFDGRAYAYPFSALSQAGVVNDELEGIPVVVVFDRASATGVMFRRDLDGRMLSFTKPIVGGDAVLIVDKETGSVWDGLGGAPSVTTYSTDDGNLCSLSSE